MISLSRGLAEVVPYYDSSNRGMIRVLLNSSSSAEAHLAVIALRDEVPAKSLVTMINLREVLRELPSPPLAIPVEVPRLARIAGYGRVKSSWSRCFSDGGGEYQVIFLGQGNLLYDVVVSSEGEKVFWSPCPGSQDIIDVKALDLSIRHDTLLARVIELAKDMGCVFQPKFYMSLEDWLLEHAEDSLRGIEDFF